jgi:segregation and condensation protein A
MADGSTMPSETAPSHPAASTPTGGRRASEGGGEYLVRLEQFQGPLDLLLFLIRRAEVDIHDIPIHEITQQYLEHLGELHRIDMETAGEFLVLAATLVEIKAKSLTPREEGSDGSDAAEALAGLDRADPRLDLVRQLLAYQRFRDASEALESLRQEHARRHEVRVGVDEPAQPTPEEDEESSIELEDAHVLDLLEAFERIIAAVDLDRLGDHRVEMDETPLALHQADLIDRLERAPGRRLSLQEAFAGRRRLEMIGLFLATLELARSQRLAIRQAEGEAGLVAPIEIELLEPTEAAAPVVSPATS